MARGGFLGSASDRGALPQCQNTTASVASSKATMSVSKAGVPAMLCSALHNEGIEELWQAVQGFKVKMQASGEFDEKRKLQANDWMWSLVQEELKDLFMRDKHVAGLIEQVQTGVSEGITTPSAAARRLLEAFKRH